MAQVAVTAKSKLIRGGGLASVTAMLMRTVRGVDDASDGIEVDSW